MQCGVAELENLKMILTHECYDEFLFCCDLTEKYEEERLTQAIALAWDEFRVNDVKGLKEQKTALNYTPTEGSAADMRARLVALEVTSYHGHAHSKASCFHILNCYLPLQCFRLFLTLLYILYLEAPH